MLHGQNPTEIRYYFNLALRIDDSDDRNHVMFLAILSGLLVRRAICHSS